MQLSRRHWIRLSAAGLALPLVPRSAFASPADPIRLHSNENPYAPSLAAREAVRTALNEANLYPSRSYETLEAMIAKKEQLTPEHVVLGAGSTEVLRMAAMAYGLAGGEVLTAYPTYEGLETYANTIDAHVHRVPLTDTLQMDLPAMDQRTTQGIQLIFVCNPNNPTGTICHKDELKSFCEEVSRRCVVLVDEAYYELVDDPAYASAKSLVAEGRNVVVSRTFSKVFGLAGLRVGYALARPDIAARLRKYRTGNGINILGIRAAAASYKDAAFVEQSRQQIAASRREITEKLRTWGHHCPDSHTNFVFFHLGRRIEPFQQAMAKRGVLVGRPFPPYLDWCRLSIGTPDEMARFESEYKFVTSDPPAH
ncbi:MAG: histidinol-phosphate transaminase [Bacteroidota bacterium]|nr:histidinol-phosphate transaminase [Bacteroidota bacterium]